MSQIFPHPLWRINERHSRQSGMALVIVLSMLVLITALVTGLLIRAGYDHAAATSYHASSSARQLADTAVNLVQGQINQATSLGAGYAWASQPGAVRVYNNSGNLNTIYRLYSAANLTTSQASDLAKDLPPTNWASSPAQWVDLNAPAMSANSTATISYPILDPRALSSMDGFSNSASSVITTTATQSAPMPVQWFYVLQNGKIVPPTTVSGTLVDVVGASKDNPIIGRIAYWTDDETCKVNINTAGGDGKVTTPGDYSDIANKTFWDVPHFAAIDEWNLANMQPCNQEFQRYPGHPGTVALNNVLYGLGLNLSSVDFYSLTPRYNYGGSMGATQPFSPTAASVPLASARLYPSVAEMLFNPSRSQSAINANNAASRQRAETARFFLTTHSRSPEVNLFGLPRISVWPIASDNDSNHRTAVDQLLAFDSTVGGNPYYFQRKNPKSTTADLNLTRNKQLLLYLDRLTQNTTLNGIPGFGGNFVAKYPEPKMRQILTEMFDYVRITNLNDPALQASYQYAPGFATGWGFGATQVTPTVNNDAGWGTQGFGAFPRINEVALQFVCLGQGAVAGSNSVPIAAKELELKGAVSFSSDIHSVSGVIKDNEIAIQSFVLLNFTSVAQHLRRSGCYFWVTIDGLDQLTLNNIPMGFPSSPIMNISGDLTGDNYGGPFCTGYMSFLSMIGAGGADRVIRQTQNQGSYTFYSSVLALPSSNGMSLGSASGAVSIPLTIKTYGPGPNDSTPGDLIQTLHVSVPTATFNVPKLATHRVIGVGDKTDGNRWKLDRILPNPLIEPSNDVMQSLVLNSSQGWGDARMLAASNISSSAFTPHPLWAQPDTQMAHNSFYGTFVVFPGNANKNYWGTLVGGFSYPVENPPDPSTLYYPAVPPTVKNVTLSAALPGDWDSGSGCFLVDGPWINKSDEGSLPNAGGMPYMDSSSLFNSITSSGFFSPNREIPSPVMFGSLSTGVDPSGINPQPWQTLLFRPAPGHPGAIDPKDHLLLDLFWMPVAEPYAISEPFSSAGKINLNYQIVPFTYIKRSTALRAALGTEKVARLGKTDAINYRRYDANTVAKRISTSTRYSLNVDETLKQFEDRFSGTGDYNTPDIFKSPSQICDQYLVPKDTTLAQFKSEWYGDKYALVGDNIRERPYANIYGKITTKSNTFTVYYTVQVLKNPATTPGQWNERNGSVMGEYRGSTTLERYIDPNATIPDYVTDASASSLETYYKWRVVESHQFAP